MENTHFIRLYNSIDALLGRNEADGFAKALPLAASAGSAAASEWAAKACLRLERLYTPDEVKSIRMACHCRTNAASLKKAKKLFDGCKDDGEFCEKFTEGSGGGFSAWCDGDAIWNCQ